MRFDKIEKFKIDELLLDEGNYRFSEAEDQKACVKKIYDINNTYFKGLMESIAKHDVGEPLLVYRDKQKNIVSDGNRRLSALKVLHNDDYAPTEAIKQYAKELRDTHKVDFNEIQAQVSDDKALVALTVYERHSSGKKGVSRVPWNAYAAARFGFDEKLGDHNEWRIMALLSEVEQKHPHITAFTRSSDFSYEVFRRLIRGAIRLGRISENIFAMRGERIKVTARKDLVKDAVTKAHKFLLIMKKKEITLSRKGDSIYADKDNVEKFLLENFALSPDNQELEDAKSGSDSSEESTEDEQEADDETSKNGDGAGARSGQDSGGDNDNGEENEGDDTSQQSDNSKSGHGVDRSDEIEKKLKDLGSRKLKKLYNSLCTISLRQHPELMYAGAWMFFEILSKEMGNVNPQSGKRQSEFAGFFSGKMNTWRFQKQIREECFSALKEIQEYGNTAKHSIRKTRETALQLRNDFEVLEPLILAVLDDITVKKEVA